MRFVNRNLLMIFTLIFLFAFTTTGTGGPTYKHVLSSGLFLVPENAQSLDWVVVNNSPKTQTFRVTVYRGNIGALKTAVLPGSLEFTLEPGFTMHNPNSVCTGCPFEMGFYYEVVVETNNLKVMPTVTVWSDLGAAVIPGTTILPGNFVEIQ